jgi:RimJ/RimL family protein N-acetyltransferase
MEFFPATLSRAETEAMISTIEERISQHGFGFWAAELKETKGFIGFIGLNVPGSWRLVGGWGSIAGVKVTPKREHVRPSPSDFNCDSRKSFLLLQ